MYIPFQKIQMTINQMKKCIYYQKIILVSIFIAYNIKYFNMQVFHFEGNTGYKVMTFSGRLRNIIILFSIILIY